MSLLESLVGLIAPPDCLACGAEGLALCSNCSRLYIQPFGERCWRCNRLSPGSRTCQSCRHVMGPSYVWISTSYEEIAQNLVQKYKFGHLRAASEPLANIMLDTFHNFSPDKLKYLVVPVPTATSRVRERGLGHSELLAKTITAKLRLPYLPALRRLGQSRQLGSKRQDRLIQLSDSFAIKLPRQTKGQNILLVDDVLTTGGTLISATKALRAAGATRVDALLFAKRL
jgi:ComF family protein